MHFWELLANWALQLGTSTHRCRCSTIRYTLPKSMGTPTLRTKIQKDFRKKIKNKNHNNSQFV